MNEIKLLSKLILSIGIIVFSQSVFSQTDNDSTSKNNIDSLTVKKPKSLLFGCGFGLSFIGGTNVSLSPNLTYKLSDKVFIGSGLQINYTDIKGYQRTTTYGANVLGQYSFTPKVTTSLEFAQLRVSTKTVSDNSRENYWDSALFVGLGYNITNKITMGAKYNLLYKDGESIYTTPIIPFVNISF